MAQKPSLKLRLGSTSSIPNLSPSLDTPASTSTPKIKISFGGGTKKATPAPSDIPTVPAGEPSSKTLKKPKKDKPTRTPAPTAKKRDLAASTLSDGDDDPDLFVDTNVPPSKPSKKSKVNASLNSSPAAKKLKLSTKVKKATGIGLLKVKTPITPHHTDNKKKSKIPSRPLGVGYDSEASDREIDPAIEEDFILRMADAGNAQSELLARAIDERRIGIPTAQGGLSFSLQFLHPQGRRALVKVEKQRYAATLVDLPCIIEGHKSWDRKTWYKGADICQMLLVLGTVEGEEQAKEYPLPTDVDPKTFQYAHGLTPPMRNVRKRRFRKRISNTVIQEVEDEVERLLQLDESSIGRTRAEVLDLDHMTRERSSRSMSGGSLIGRDIDAEGDEDTEMGDDEDAEGSIDQDTLAQNVLEEASAHAQVSSDDDLEADIERAMMEASESPEPASSTSLQQPQSQQPQEPSTATTASTPAPTTPGAPPASSGAEDDEGGVAEDSGDVSSDEAEEISSADEVDEATLEAQQFLQRQREEIADLEAAVRSEEAKLAGQSNAIFRKKGIEKIRSLKKDLELKRGAIGEGEDDGGEDEGEG